MTLDLSDLTILITTYNRPVCLTSLLEYFVKLNSKVKIVVLDSSDFNIKNKKINNYIEKNYIEYKSFPSNIGVVQKISQGSSLIRTKFCTLCADDDFLFPSALYECMQFLKFNKDYISCHGKYFLHHYLNFKNFNLIKGFQIIDNYFLYENNSPSKRLEDYLYLKIKSIGPFYAVHRSKNFQSIYNKLSKKIYDFGLNEIVFCSISLINGKLKYLPLIYSSRSPNFYLGNYSYDKLKNNYSESKINKAIEIIAFELNQNSNLSLKKSISIVRKNINNYKDIVLERAKSRDKKTKIKEYLMLIILPIIRSLRVIRKKTDFDYSFTKSNEFIYFKTSLLTRKDSSVREIEESRKKY